MATTHKVPSNISKCFPGGTVVKNPPANEGDARDVGLIPGSGRSPGVGNGNPLQYSCLENSMDRQAWGATVLSSTCNRQYFYFNHSNSCVVVFYCGFNLHFSNR